jgi:Cof subfamily protein (haloacid dehalogenase superfamily)
MPAPSFPSEPIDLRLVVTDLDGTLLDGEGRIPESLWPLLARLTERGITLVPASGRQYPTLRRMFDVAEGVAFIAENGTYVVHDGDELSCTPLADGLAVRLVGWVRELVAAGHDVGVVWCGRRSAYIERNDPAFVAEIAAYYAALELVADLREVSEPAMKCAIFDFGDIESGTAPVLTERCAPHQVVVSGQHWADVMSSGVNKGVAVASLQRELGITPEQTVVFGDYLNDVEMLAATPHSFAMANAHPDVIEAARYLAPANDEAGVVAVLERVLDAVGAA